jgi:hypothetical protein
VRHLSIDCSLEGEKRLRQAVPVTTRVLSKPAALAVVEDTCFTAYDICLIAPKVATDAVVGTVLKAIWEI